MRELLRTTTYLVLALLALVAIASLTLRIATANLDRLEPWVNAILANSNIELAGMSGEWRQFNPVIHVKRISFANGTVRNVEFEYDTFESLIRNRVVARKLVVKRGEFVFDRIADNWFDGQSRFMGELDRVRQFVSHSDELHIHSDLKFRSGRESQSFTFEVKKVESGDEHLTNLQVKPKTGCESLPCGFNARILSAENPMGFAPSILEMQVSTRELNIHPSALGINWSTPIECEASLDWIRDDSGGRGISSLMLRTIGDNDDYRLTTSFAFSRQEDTLYALATSNTVSKNDETHELPQLTATYDDGNLVMNLEQFEVADLAAFIGDFLGTSTVTGEWLRQLSLGGTLTDVGIKYDANSNSLGYTGEWMNYSHQPYLEMPKLSVDEFHFDGLGRFFILQFEDSEVDIKIDRHFPESWNLTTRGGLAYLYLGREHVGLEAFLSNSWHDGIPIDLRVRFARDTKVAQHVFSFAASTLGETIQKQQAMSYLPKIVGGPTIQWIKDRVIQTSISNIDVVYFNAIDDYTHLLHTNFAMSAQISDGQVEYLEGWHPATAVFGHVNIDPERVHFDIEQASVANINLLDTDIRVPLGAKQISVNFAVETELAATLAFVNSSPLSQLTAEISRHWDGEGDVEIAASLTLPLGEEPPAPDSIQITMDLSNSSLTMHDWQMHFEHINGGFDYVNPYGISTADTTAELFGRPAFINIESRSSNAEHEYHTEVVVDGKATANDIAELVGVATPEFIEGETEFHALLEIFPETNVSPKFRIFSDLTGIQIDLPHPLKKSKEERTPLLTFLEFDGESTVVRVESDVLNGWLNYSDETIQSGTFGIATQELPYPADAAGLLLTGNLVSWDLDFGNLSEELPFPIELSGLTIDRLSTNMLPLNAVAIDGIFRSTRMEMTINSDEFAGTISRVGQDPWSINAKKLVLEVSEESNDDPLLVEWLDLIPPVDLLIDSVVLIREDGSLDDYGSWQFHVRPDVAGLRISDLTAQVKHLEIELLGEDGAIIWHRESNRTSASARVFGTDLSEVLPAWGYDATVESSDFELKADVDWPGSPLNFSPTVVTGDIFATAHEGRFVQAQDIGGAIRIASLMNFSEWLNRLQFNFADVVEEGFAYNEVEINAHLHDTLLSFNEPMTIDGPGCEFQINGTVNIDSGELDNEMIVTIPLHKSLPWYAAYVTFANPALGIGLFITTQGFTNVVFEPLTSGRYEVGGTLEDPNIRFVELFQNTLRSPRNTDNQQPN